MGEIEEEQKQRIQWPDTVKYVCIILVMLCHLEANTDIWGAFYSPFFLSAFFVVSGYVYEHKASFLKVLCKKIRQLLIPWLVFSVLNILLAQVLSFNKHESLLTELKWNFLQIRGRGDEIWFVAALFVAFIPFYFFIKWYEGYAVKTHKSNTHIVAILFAWILSLISVIYTKMMPAGALPWSSTSLPWHIEYVFQAMFYMVLGYIFRQQYEGEFDKYNTFLTRITVWAIYLLLVYIPYFTNAKLPFIAKTVYDYISSITGITALVMTTKVVKSNRYVKYVGQNTLIYFALHGKLYSLVQTMLRRYVGGVYNAILDNVVISSVFALAFALVLSFLLIIPAYVTNRWFPWLLGRTYRLRKP